MNAMKRIFEICNKCKSFDVVEAVTTIFPPSGRTVCLLACCKTSKELPIYCGRKDKKNKAKEKFEELDIPEDCLMKTEYNLIEWNE